LLDIDLMAGWWSVRNHEFDGRDHDTSSRKLTNDDASVGRKFDGILMKFVGVGS
jgi:hypothetical protein